MELSKMNRGILAANNKGYRIIEGKIINPRGKILVGGYDKDGYHFFSLVHDRERFNVKVHRLVAFQKFGEKIFTKGLVVRHLDNNNKNNQNNNIELGTIQENELDKPLDLRRRASIQRAQGSRK